MGHGLGVSSPRDKTMPYIGDNTIITTTAAVGNSTPRNTVYIFLLHYNCYIIIVSIVFVRLLASGDSSCNE